MAAIHARELSKEYRLGRDNRVRALDHVDLHLEDGALAAILGKSGSGKSTLMNLIGGLDRPTSGTIHVGDQDLGRLGQRALARYRASTVGFVFQSFNLQPRFPAWENVALPLVFAGMDRRSRKRRALALLDRVGLGERAQHRPTELSGGEQQRVALARSLAAEPKLLLADEPTGNLDSQTSAQIVDLLREIHAAGTTIVLVTHDRELAAGCATHVVRMVDGRIATADDAHEGVS